MTHREKIAHLYRRLGFGATPEELDAGEKRGVEATAKHLIEYTKVPDTFPLDKFELCWREKEEPDLGTWRLRIWWYLRMMATPRPLEEKLALFWHNHFAVSDSKVEDGLMMMQYLDVLRRNASGKFGDLLVGVSTNPAMMRYLDMQRAMRGHPNENFAREVMELFTLGIGNYTEKDVQEASRALTGWGYVFIFWELPGNTDQKVREAIKYQRPFSSFTYMPDMRDPTPKTILGKTRDFDGYALLQMLAEHPATAKHLSAKLWTYFAYDDPEPAVVDALSKVWLSKKGDMQAMMHAIVKRPEFWSDKCVRRRVKSPAELMIGICRQQGIGEYLMSLRDPKADVYTRVPNKMLDPFWGLSSPMEKAGMDLFYPPDVSGWKWGTAWISPAAMIERMKFRGMLLWDNGAGVGTLNVVKAVAAKNPQTNEAMAAAFCELFDCPLPEASRAVFAEALGRMGGVEMLKKPNDCVGLVSNALGMLMAAPEMHMC